MQENPTEEKFSKAYEEYADALFRHCYLRVFERESAKDLVQETFIKTWEYIAKGNTVQNMRAFLYKVANNLIIDRSRKKRAPLSLDYLVSKGLHPVSKESAEALNQHIEVKGLITLLDQLPLQDRDFIVMRYIDGFSVKEIAEISNQKENYISVHLYRSFEKLRKLANEKR